MRRLSFGWLTLCRYFHFYFKFLSHKLLMWWLSNALQCDSGENPLRRLQTDTSVLSLTFEAADLLYHRGLSQSSPAAISFPVPVQAFVSMVIEQAIKRDCKLCLDPSRALETTCHITFISLLNCKTILCLRPHFKWCARRASELTHSTFNLAAGSLLGHSAIFKKHNGG